MPATTLNLFFPQWQGSGAENAKQLREGAWQVQSLLSQLEFSAVTIDDDALTTPDDEVKPKTSLVKQARQARDLIKQTAPERIFTLGGDCGVDLGPATFLHEQYGSDLGLIWLDAHADLNTPTSSPSGRFHGMVLRVMLGEGDEDLLGSAFSSFEPYQVFLCGVREFDAPEYAYFEENRISLFKPADVESHPEQLTELIAARGFSKLHIHLDLDVLDPKVFSSTGYPAPGGMSLEGVIALLTRLDATFDTVGFTLTEFLPTPDTSDTPLSVLRELLEVVPLTSPKRL